MKGGLADPLMVWTRPDWFFSFPSEEDRIKHTGTGWGWEAGGGGWWGAGRGYLLTLPQACEMLPSLPFSFLLLCRCNDTLFKDQKET